MTVIEWRVSCDRCAFVSTLPRSFRTFRYETPNGYSIGYSQPGLCPKCNHIEPMENLQGHLQAVADARLLVVKVLQEPDTQTARITSSSKKGNLIVRMLARLSRNSHPSVSWRGMQIEMWKRRLASEELTSSKFSTAVLSKRASPTRCLKCGSTSSRPIDVRWLAKEPCPAILPYRHDSCGGVLTAYKSEKEVPDIRAARPMFYTDPVYSIEGLFRTWADFAREGHWLRDRPEILLCKLSPKTSSEP